MTFSSLPRMTSSSTQFRGRFASVLGPVFVAGLLSAPSFAAFAQTATPAAKPPALSAEEKAAREAWRLQMVHAPREKGACYTATYPDTTWHQVPCKTPPKHYFGPGPFKGSNSDTVGSGNDYAAVPANPITLAEGSFDASNATSVQTEMAGAGGVNGANMFSLQLNTDYFQTKLCTANNLGSTCRGVAQFVYDGSTQEAYVQYWLATTNNLPLPGYPNSCPLAADGRRSPGTVSIPPPPPNPLQRLQPPPTCWT